MRPAGAAPWPSPAAWRAHPISARPGRKAAGRGGVGGSLRAPGDPAQCPPRAPEQDARGALGSRPGWAAPRPAARPLTFGALSPLGGCSGCGPRARGEEGTVSGRAHRPPAARPPSRSSPCLDWNFPMSPPRGPRAPVCPRPAPRSGAGLGAAAGHPRGPHAPAGAAGGRGAGVGGPGPQGPEGSATAATAAAGLPLSARARARALTAAPAAPPAAAARSAAPRPPPTSRGRAASGEPAQGLALRRGGTRANPGRGGTASVSGEDSGQAACEVVRGRNGPCGSVLTLSADSPDLPLSHPRCRDPQF